MEGLIVKLVVYIVGEGVELAKKLGQPVDLVALMKQCDDEVAAAMPEYEAQRKAQADLFPEG